MTAVDAEQGKEFVDDFIEHYGVKGMRWGVRRTDAQLARAGAKKSGDDDSGSKSKKVVGKTKTSGKSASQMSDKELKRVVDRINTEQQYARLTAPPPGKAAAVSKFFAGIAVNAARTNLQTIANAQGAKLVGDLMATKSGGPRIPPPPNRFPSAPPNPLDRIG